MRPRPSFARLFGLALCFLLALTARGADLELRLERLLGPAAGERAGQMVRARQFAQADALVAVASANTKDQQSEKWALRGALNFLAGHMEDAAQCFESASSLAELRETDRFTLAMAWVKMGRDEDARKELTQLALQPPPKPLYEYWLGRIDYDQRRYQEAVVHFKSATQLDDKFARAWDGLGLAFDMQGNEEQALHAFERGAELNRDQPQHSPWPPHDLGALLLRTGQTKAAEAAFREALSYDPHMEQAHYHLGRALEKEGAESEAAVEYTVAMKEDEKAADVCYSLAMLYKKMHRDQEAEALFVEWRRRRDAQ